MAPGSRIGFAAALLALPADFDAAQTTEYVRSETRRWQPIAKSSTARND